jgi:hypothetical protein
METRVSEAVWIDLTILGKQLLTTILSRIQELATVDEREKVLKIMKYIIIIDKPHLENSDSLNEFFDTLQSMTSFQMV